MQYLADVFQVVGGAANGGLIVRRGRETSSKVESDRLGVGAKIRVVQRTDGRAAYELISGKGPQMGWVASSFQGKDTIAKLFNDVEEKSEKPVLKLDCFADIQNDDQIRRDGEIKDHLNALDEMVRDQQYTSDNKSTEVLQEPVIDDSQDALQKYGKRLGMQSSKTVVANKTAFASQKTEAPDVYKSVSKSVVSEEFAADLGMPLEAVEAEDQEDPNMYMFEEDVVLCHLCNLPTGDVVYDGGNGCVLHGECVAQLTVLNLRAEDEARQQEDADTKVQRHEEYGVGWKMENIPRNAEAAGKLAMRDVPQGMVCLISDEASKTVQIASTTEPASSINLEYLSLSLEVRRREGHEPFFSLDPGFEGTKMQEKVLVPAWLKGTSVGEVLFQADYHLKELSMGECDQPVVGLKSCFDHWDLEDDFKEWNAREWFLVRKAEVRLLEGSVLIPFVKMGVEAREMTFQEQSLQDKPLTRPDHPMVKYAEAFTRSFDLIAERKSVIYHLRELAKASIMAKHLLDAHIDLEESWFHLAADRQFAYSQTVPQLWNERAYAQIQLEDGAIVEDTHKSTRAHGVYGGVQFGLDKFDLSSSTREGPAGPVSRPALAKARADLADVRAPIGMAMSFPAARAPRVTFAGRLAAAVAAPEPPKAAAAPKAQPAAGVRAGVGVPGAVPALRPAMQALSFVPMSQADLRIPYGDVVRPTYEFADPNNRPQDRLARFPELKPLAKHTIGYGQLNTRLQGVDLRLDSFDVSTTKQVSKETQLATSDYVAALDDCTAIGDAFWKCIDNRSEIFNDEDRSLLKEVFNPVLSDRRQEGDCFSPPDISYSYIMKLRALVKEEDLVRKQRKEEFFNKGFSMSDPGSLFPCSWKPSFEMARGRHSVRMPEGQPQGVLQARPEYNKGHLATLLSHILRISAPIFDRRTEEGLSFRIYRIGGLEVRTTLGLDDQEEIGAVFSIGARAGGVESCIGKSLKEDEEFTKVTEYVEAALDSSSLELHCRFYLVLETSTGRRVVMERMRDGKVTWEEDPNDLDDRSSLAKVTRCSPCYKGLTVREMSLFHSSASQQLVTGDASPAECRTYVQEAFNGIRLQEEPVELPSLTEVAREMRLSLQAENEAEAQANLEVQKLLEDDLPEIDVSVTHVKATEKLPGTVVTFADDADLVD